MDEYLEKKRDEFFRKAALSIERAVAELPDELSDEDFKEAGKYYVRVFQNGR